MQFDSWADFWAMGGYAFYVWLSFVISFLALALLLLDSSLTKQKLFKQVVTEVARKARIKRSRQSNNDLKEKAKHES
jgi:heme exporter protein D